MDMDMGMDTDIDTGMDIMMTKGKKEVLSENGCQIRKENVIRKTNKKT